MIAISGRPVEMGDDTGAAEESWEGLGAEDKEGADEENEDKDSGEDLVSEIVLTSSFTKQEVGSW